MNDFCLTNDKQSSSPRQVALAILYREGKFLMQLRDNIPTILHPGVWGLFGGHLEPGETPEDALRREIKEEIHYQLVSPAKFRCYADKEAVRYIYYSPLTVSMKQLSLQEGWDFALVPTDAIRQGQYYSAKANQVRPLGSLHRTILLDFLEAQLTSETCFF